MELIKIDVNANQEPVVSGRELYDALEIKTPYTQWFERMIEYGFVEDQDFILVSQKCETNNPKNPVVIVKDHAIKLDMAKEIAMIQRTEKGKQVRQYFIECEKKLKVSPHQELSPQLQLLIRMDLEQKEIMQIAQRAEVTAAQAKEDIQVIRDVIVLDPSAWRSETTNLINKIAMQLGGYENIQAIRKESYELLDSRGKAKLNIRQTNMRRKVLEETGSKAKADKVTKLDVIAADARLREVYIAIIKEMAIKYGIA